MSDIERDERGRIVIKSLSSEKAREMARKRWEQPSQVELTGFEDNRLWLPVAFHGHSYLFGCAKRLKDLHGLGRIG